MQQSFRRRLIVSFIGLAVIPLLLSAVVVVWSTYQQSLQDSFLRQQELSQRIRVQVESLFQRVENILETSLNPLVFSDLGGDKKEELLGSILSRRELFRSAISVNSQRMVETRLSNQGIVDRGTPMNDLQNLVFWEAAQSGNYFYSAVHFDDRNNEPLITIGVPVKDPRSPVAPDVIVLEMRFKVVWDLFSQLETRGGESIYLVDTHGRLVAHQNPSLVLKGSSISITGDMIQSGLRRPDVVVALDHLLLGSRQFSVVVERPVREVRQNALEQLWNQLFVAMLSIMVAILMFLFVSRNLLRPVKAISETATAIREGDWKRQVASDRNDEFGEMAAAFNSMTTRLSETLEQLQRENRRRAQAERKLKYANEHLETLTQFETNWIYWRSEDQSFFHYMSPTCERFTGYTVQEFQDDSGLLDRIIHPEDRRKWMEHDHLRDSTGNILPQEFRLITKSGEQRWISHTCQAVVRDNGALEGRHGSNQDITERKRVEERLRLLASVFSHSREGIVITDHEARIVDVNQAFTLITGYSREEMIGRNPSILKSGLQDDDFYRSMWDTLIANSHWSGEIWNRRQDGEVYAEVLTISAVKDSRGKVQHYVGLFTDISQQKAYQKHLEYIAHYDSLTNLPNRILLGDRLKQAMAQARRRNQRLAVAYLDLDGFKEINDTHGHDVGDSLLVNLSASMKHALREEDTVARLGGDEFVAVLIDLSDNSSSVQLLTRLLEAVSQTVHVDELALQVSASIGVSFYPQDEEIDADQLLRQADQAMYQAKLSGKNRFHVFDASHDSDIRGHHENLERIRQGLRNNEFVLYYQPKVHMQSGHVVGAEALIRWQHPEQGLLAPDRFLPVIEGHPLIVELGDWVFRAAMMQMEEWRKQGINLPLSVNVSARQLQDESFLDRLRSLLDEFTGLEPGSLELEVLETSALEDMYNVSQVIHECSRLGVNFALDDFGTGYSSLTYLKLLPATHLKIDRSFVRDMLEDPEDLAILEGILGLATAFRRQVIAEGVESVEHGVMLLQLGCQLAQGYAIARPMPAEVIGDWLNEWKPYPEWINQHAVRQDDWPVIFSGVEITHWIQTLERFLEGHTMTMPKLDPHECRFGQWIDVEGRERYGDNEEYWRVVELHNDLHEVGRELVNFSGRYSAQEVLEKVQEIHRRRDELLHQLAELVR